MSAGTLDPPLWAETTAGGSTAAKTIRPRPSEAAASERGLASRGPLGLNGAVGLHELDQRTGVGNHS